jgi:hypothetical protein
VEYEYDDEQEASTSSGNDTGATRERRIVRGMMRNERTLDLSKRFEVSPGRISQMRRELHDDWRRFLGERDEAGPSLA